MVVQPIQPHALNMRDAVVFSGLSRSRLYQLFSDNSLPSFHVGGRRMILRTDLQTFLESAAARG